MPEPRSYCRGCPADADDSCDYSHESCVYRDPAKVLERVRSWLKKIETAPDGAFNMDPMIHLENIIKDTMRDAAAMGRLLDDYVVMEASVT
ncbi:hypothetical protein D4R42_04485 [bacterium]|nr:MAG: hypothetical protein D4R42_04485 [bacterium]